MLQLRRTSNPREFFLVHMSLWESVVTSFKHELYSNACTVISGAFITNTANMSPSASPYQTACNNSYGVSLNLSTGLNVG